METLIELKKRYSGDPNSLGKYKIIRLIGRELVLFLKEPSKVFITAKCTNIYIYIEN